jgi:integrase/recombinase XerD
MKAVADFSPLCQSFFSKRLITQRKASSHTVSAYAQTFRLFIAYAQKRLRTPPAMLSLAQLDASFIAEFLDNLESNRSNSARSRNARLASLRSFYHYAALEAPQHASLIQRVLAIPYKRLARRLVNYLTRPEIEAVLASVDKSTWVGRRNHALLLVAMQTGLRLSEITGLRQRDVVLGRGAHVRCEGKGRKERCTPLAKPTVVVLKAWINEQGDGESQFLFPSSRGDRLSADAVQHALAKQVTTARARCPSLIKKQVTPHVLRHYLPFLTMSGNGVPLPIWSGDSRSRSGKPQRIARHSLMSATDCSGRRGVGHRVCSDPAFHPAGMSWQVLSPSWQVSLRDKSVWFQHVRDRATMR